MGLKPLSLSSSRWDTYLGTHTILPSYQEISGYIQAREKEIYVSGKDELTVYFMNNKTCTLTSAALHIK
jgi:hypothetical protein